LSYAILKLTQAGLVKIAAAECLCAGAEYRDLLNPATD
jgi:hypothetical protein